jgi:hypothetical protein
MSDPNRDWLDEELKALGDLQAPDTLLPKVMSRVRRRALIPRWARLWSNPSELWRSFALGFALVVLCLLAAIDPSRLAAGIPSGNELWKFCSILGDAATDLLLYGKVFQLPLFLLIAVGSVASYLGCLGAAVTVQRLVRAKR